jgi:hypothetical protein
MQYSKYEAKTHTSYNKSLHEIRFKVLFFLFRIGGITFNMNSASRLTAVYNAIVIACFYITNVCICVDAFVHRHQLTLAMKQFGLVLGMQMCMCSHFSVR